MRQFIIFSMALFYLGGVAFFALRPLEPIVGRRYEKRSVRCEEGAVRLQRGAALEDRRNARRMRNAILKSGAFSLVADFQSDALIMDRSARILGYSRDCTAMNFALTQEGGAILFLQKNTGSSFDTPYMELLVPVGIDPSRWHVLVATFDGATMRLYVDGRLRGERATGAMDLSKWEADVALAIGDKPAGLKPWSGLIRRIEVFDRALDMEEVLRIHAGEEIDGAVVNHDFRSMDKLSSPFATGLEPLRYRNLFVLRDASLSLTGDIVANVAGFLPLGFFACMVCPSRLGRRSFVCTLLSALVIGLMVSGGIEWSQRYLIMRVPSVVDLATNITGTVVGAVLTWLSMFALGNGVFGRRAELGNGS